MSKRWRRELFQETNIIHACRRHIGNALQTIAQVTDTIGKYPVQYQTIIIIIIIMQYY